jgi:hypothetical protein
MNRKSFQPSLGALLLIGVIGCAHCDTCDDFPRPCVGQGCGHGMMVAPPMAGVPVAANRVAIPTTANAVAEPSILAPATPGPFSRPAASLTSTPASDPAPPAAPAAEVSQPTTNSPPASPTGN